MKTQKPFLLTFLLAVIGASLWQLSVVIFHIPEYLLPTPYAIAKVAWSEWISYFYHAGVTLAEASLGFAVANITAIVAAILIVYVPILHKAMMPFAIALKTTPIVAMAPLLLLWLGNGLAPKVAAAALICFFPAFVNSLKGFDALGDGEADLFRTYGASNTQILFKLRFPRAAPYIFSALKVSSSLAIVGAIVGEFVGANRGIGYVILVSSYHLESVKMFAALIYAAAAGILLYGLIALIDLRVVYWFPKSTDELRLESPPRRIAE